MKMVHNTHINPPHNSMIKATDKYGMISKRGQTANSFAHYPGTDWVSELSAQLRGDFRISNSDFADRKRIQNGSQFMSMPHMPPWHISLPHMPAPHPSIDSERLFDPPDLAAKVEYCVVK